MNSFLRKADRRNLKVVFRAVQQSKRIRGCFLPRDGTKEKRGTAVLVTSERYRLAARNAILGESANIHSES
jgi:hypothetical protein